MKDIIGREQEIKVLNTLYGSKQSEFIAVYGRRRVGKTFLIRKFFDEKFTFEVSGLANSTAKEQLLNFNISLKKYFSGAHFKPATNWLDAFEKLITLLIASSETRKVVFIDEISWFDRSRSGFLTALEHFWNGWASTRNDIMLIVCGSASSWIINKLINNRKGLYNRLTRSLHLRPFTLRECEEFFCSRKIAFSRHQIAECYMVMGGVPYYLNQIEKGLSVAQNIDNMFFAHNSKVRNEFENLYGSLFDNSEDYLSVVKALSKKTKGLSRNEIATETKLTSGGGLTLILKNLEYSGFIRTYNALNKSKRDTLYQLIDHFTLFYERFVSQNKYSDEHFWTNSLGSPFYYSWAGYAFERIALLHIEEIRRALGISGIQSLISSWRSVNSSPAAQIDIVISRKDGIINLLEIKFSKENYVITKSYEENLRNKVAAFKYETKTRNAVHLIMLTTYGVTQNACSEIVQKELTLDDLF